MRDYGKIRGLFGVIGKLEIFINKINKAGGTQSEIIGNFAPNVEKMNEL